MGVSGSGGSGAPEKREAKLSTFDEEHPDNSPQLNALIRDLKERDAKRARMRSPEEIEWLLAHTRDGHCSGNPACREEIVRILEWVLGLPGLTVSVPAPRS